MNGFNISVQVDVACIPDSDGLYKDARLLSPLDIAKYIDPRANIDLIVLHCLEKMFNIDVDYLVPARRRISMFKSQDGGLDNVVIDAAQESNLCSGRTFLQISQENKMGRNRTRHVV